MPKIDINTEEQAELTRALELAQASAKRAQNTSKMPQLKEIYAKQEHDILTLAAKIKAAK